jgi:hypothetical protein
VVVVVVVERVDGVWARAGATVAVVATTVSAVTPSATL